MSELGDLVKTLLNRGMGNMNNAGIKPTKDDREKFMLQEERRKSEELQKKLDAQKEQHVAELKMGDIEKGHSEAAILAQIESIKATAKHEMEMFKIQIQREVILNQSSPEAMKRTAALEEECRRRIEELDHLRKRYENDLE
jgi:hypothetical protein